MSDIATSTSFHNYSFPGNASVLTKSDSETFAPSLIYIGGTGNIKVKTAGGQEVTFNSVPVGVFPVRVTKVFSTDTTATNMVRIY